MEGWLVITEAEALQALKTLLSYVGEDPAREGLLETPKRIIRSYQELLSGYTQDPQQILAKSFQVGDYDQMIIVRGIEFTSFCEHHWLPFQGRATVAYIPQGQRVVGLSKLARVVDVFAKRLQIQERMTMQIADAVETALKPAGVAVLLEATHQCMACRGARKPRASMVTSDLRGAFREGKVRKEFMDLGRSNVHE